MNENHPPDSESPRDRPRSLLRGLLPISSQLEQLERLLDQCPDDRTLFLAELDGYLAGILVSPHQPEPEDWLPEIWGGEGAQPFPDDPDRSAQLVALVHARQAEIVMALVAGDLAYDPVYEVTADGTIFWEAWIEGFSRAMALGGKPWDALFDAGDEALEKAFTGLLLYVALVRGVAKEDIDAAALEESAPEMIPWFLEILYRRRHGLDVADAQAAPLRLAVKAGRNDPCPCGSGRKYKKCCGAA